MERVMLTLPPDLLEEVDTLARRLGQKRSQVIRQALWELLERQRQQEFEATLAEGYQELARQSATVVVESLPAQSRAAEGIWQWDAYPTNLIVRQGSPEAAGTGLDRDSVVQAEVLLTIPKANVVQRLGQFLPSTMQGIDECLKDTKHRTLTSE